MLKEDSGYRYFVGYYPHREDGTKHPVFGFYNRKNGGASVYSVDGTAFGAGGSSTKAGNQGFLRLTFLDED